MESLEKRALLTAGASDAVLAHGVAYVAPVVAAEVHSVAATSAGKGKLILVGKIFQQGGEGLVLSRIGADGRADPTFGVGGSTTYLPPPQRRGHVTWGFNLQPLAVQVDSGHGVLVLASGVGNGRIMRFNADGTLDTSFTQIALDELGYTFEGVCAFTVQRDGSILVAGTQWASDQEQLAVVRLHGDGTRDIGFGQYGVAHASLSFNRRAVNVFATAMTVDARGRIILAGLEHRYFDLVRLGSDGALDTSFGRSGLFRLAQPRAYSAKSATYSELSSSPAIDSIAIRPSDGEIFFAGATTRSANNGESSAAPIMLAALTGDGLLDRSFSGDGIVTELLGSRRLPSFAQIDSVSIDNSGRPIIAGSVSGKYGRGMILGRFNTDGSPDPTFARGLANAAGSDPDLHELTLATPDRAYVGAFSGVGTTDVGDVILPVGGAPRKADIIQQTALRLNVEGNLVRAYGRNGVAIAAVQTYGPADGNRIFAASDGGAFFGTGSNVTRLNSAGSVDSGFGENGTFAFGPLKLADVQPNGRLLLAGRSGADATLLRLDAPGVRDRSFGSRGIVVLHSDLGSQSILQALPRADGSTVLIVDRQLPQSSPNIFRHHVHLLYLLDVRGDVLGEQELPSQMSFGVFPVDTSVTVARDGKVIVTYNSTLPYRDLFGGVLRFKAHDLAPDNSINHEPQFSAGVFFSLITALPNGGIALAGSTLGGHGQVTVLGADGSVDPTFGLSGTVLTAVPLALLAQRDGKILVISGNAEQITVQRLQTDGTPDPAFGVKGVLTLDAPLRFNDRTREVSATLAVVGGVERLLLSSTIVSTVDLKLSAAGIEAGYIARVDLE